MATPAHSSSLPQRKQLRDLFTPTTERVKVKTPHSRKVKTCHNEEDEDDEISLHTFKDLLMKQWYIHSLSPLFNFKHSPEMFKKYARSLERAVLQAESKYSGSHEGDLKSSFDIYPGLNFHPDDHVAVRIRVCGKNRLGGKESVLLTAFLLCVDMEGSIFPPNTAPRFCYYPVVIVNGNTTRAAVLLDWLEQHFDCRTSPLSLTDSDLRWMLAAGCSWTQCEKKMDVLLQYNMAKACSGINTMNCTFDFQFCQDLWHRLNVNMPSKETISEEEVKRFVTSIEHHIEYTMHIYVTKLSLCEIGSPMAYVSAKGKFKMFFHQSVYPTLHLLCDLAKERYTQFYQSSST